MVYVSQISPDVSRPPLPRPCPALRLPPPLPQPVQLPGRPHPNARGPVKVASVVAFVLKKGQGLRLKTSRYVETGWREVHNGMFWCFGGGESTQKQEYLCIWSRCSSLKSVLGWIVQVYMLKLQRKENRKMEEKRRRVIKEKLVMIYHQHAWPWLLVKPWKTEVGPI